MDALDDRTDAELVIAARSGDRSAFAAVYDRYADRLHTYCFVMLRDPDDAADATHDAFVKAATRLGQLRDPERLRPWLFAIARNEAHAKGRQRARSRPVDDLSEALVSEPDPIHGLAQAELKELVWSAVAGLQDRDRELMTLHLIEGLEGDDLADAVGVSSQHLHVLLSRMRDRMEKALGALLIARLGRDDCEELAELLADWDGRFSLEVRSKVTRHVESCDVCSARRAVLMTPANLLPSIVFVPAPAMLRERTLASAVRPLRMLKLRRRLPAAAVAAVATLVLLGGATTFGQITGDTTTTTAEVLASTNGTPTTVADATTTVPPTSTSTSSATSTTTSITTTTSTTTSTTSPTTTSTAPSPTTTSPPPPPPAALALDVTMLDLGAAGTSGTVSLSNTGGLAVDWLAADDHAAFVLFPVSGSLGPGESTVVTVTVDRTGYGEGDLEAAASFSGEGASALLQLAASVEVPPVIGRIAASPPAVYVPPAPGVSCSLPMTTMIMAAVTDDSGIASVVARWSPDGSQSTTPLGLAGGDYIGSVGPFTKIGDTTVILIATDTRGNTAQVQIPLRVLPC